MLKMLDCEASPMESCIQGMHSAPKEYVIGSKVKGQSHLKLSDIGHGAIGLGVCAAGFWSYFGPIFLSMPPFLPPGMGICLC